MVAMLAGVFASCQKSNLPNEIITDREQSVTINLLADDAVNTRAAADGIAQYIIEVYSDATYTTPLNIFGEGENATNQSKSANGAFNIILDRTVDYYCLFWADKDATVYTTTSLKTVALVSGKTPVQAWFGSKVLRGKETYHNIVLKRAVAKLNLLETGTILPNSTLRATFDEPTIFNVADSTVNTHVSRTIAIPNTEAVIGTPSTPAKINNTDIFILAPATTQYVTAITLQCSAEEPFNISNIPFQANYTTNIKGHYTTLANETFNVSCDDTWENPDNDSDIYPHLYEDYTIARQPSGEGTQASPYLLKCAAHIKWLQNLSKESSNTKGKYFKMATDIKIFSSNWEPIGDSHNNFLGNFDGNGHKFTGKLIAHHSRNFRFGIFGSIGAPSEVKNLINEAEVIAPRAGSVGGISGETKGGKIINCKNTAKITAKNFCAGIVGYIHFLLHESYPNLNEITLISGCENSGEIICLEGFLNFDNKLYSCVGGITGEIYFDPAKTITDINEAVVIFENNKNSGNIVAPENCVYTGGIIGETSFINGICKLKRCSNTGVVKMGTNIATQNIGNISNMMLGLLIGGDNKGYPQGEIIIED